MHGVAITGWESSRPKTLRAWGEINIHFGRVNTKVAWVVTQLPSQSSTTIGCWQLNVSKTYPCLVSRSLNLHAKSWVVIKLSIPIESHSINFEYPILILESKAQICVRYLTIDHISTLCRICWGSNSKSKTSTPIRQRTKKLCESSSVGSYHATDEWNWTLGETNEHTMLDFEKK
jgi:hypothetical protein